MTLRDVAHTLHVGRREFAHRRFVVADSLTDAAARLRDVADRPAATRLCESASPNIVFLFPGQGSQYAGMGRDLYHNEPVFQAAFDRCAEIVNPLIDGDLCDLMFAGDEGCLDQTRIAQPAIFAIEYSLAQLWLSWGVRPKAMLGHSVGEFVAACLAGIFSLEDGLRVVALRANLMQAQPPGGMLSVRANVDRVRGWLDANCAVASINAR